MAGWKKALFVALICMLVLGLMLYGDLGRNPGGPGRGVNFGSATVLDRMDGKTIDIGSGQVGDVVNLFNVTGIPPVRQPDNQQQSDTIKVEDFISSYMYFSHALNQERYYGSPRTVNDWINFRVWGGLEKLVDPKYPERAQMRETRARELGTTVLAIEDFVRRGSAGLSKQNQFTVGMKNNRSDLALLYLMARERARLRYMEFPAKDYMATAKTAVAADTEGLKKRYEEDKVKPRTTQGEIGQSMSRALKLQFDVFYLEQDAFFAAEEAKLDKSALMAEYNKQKEHHIVANDDNLLIMEKAHVTFKDYKPHDPAVKPLDIRPEWETDRNKTFLPPEDIVLDYIKYQQMIPRALIGRSQTVIRELSTKYNADLLAQKPEDRAEFAKGFLDRLKAADPKGWEEKWKLVKYLRTDLDSFHAYATAPQVQLSAETKTPYPLNTFFEQVHKRGMLPEFQKKMGDPLTYYISKEGDQDLLTPKAGGSLVFQVYKAENADSAAALMPFESKEAQDLLVERLAMVKAPILASEAAKKTLDEWKADPTKIPSDPNVLKEYVQPEADPNQPLPPGADKRLIQMLSDFEKPDAANNNDLNAAKPGPVLPGELRGPIDAPLDSAASDADANPDLQKCSVIGFIVQYHQTPDPMARMSADAGWREGYEPRGLNFALFGYYGQGYSIPGLSTKMLHTAVFDAFSTTVTPPKSDDKK